MSVVIRALGCRFQINSGDHGSPHCHVIGHGSELKVRLIGFEVMGETRFSERDATRLIELVKRYRTELMEKWEEYHGQEKKS